MFHPVHHPMERGWVGRVEGDRVVHLAAQTLQSFFTGGGSAREHALYPLAEVCLLAPVLHPPAVRVFEDERAFAFANPAAILPPRARVRRETTTDEVSREALCVLPRLAAVVGAEGAIAGFTLLAEWRDPSADPPKDRDFGLGLGPLLVTPNELDPDGLAATARVGGEERLHGRFDGFDWDLAREHAAAGTILRPGDLLAGPALGVVEGLVAGDGIEIAAASIGTLAQSAS
jgi:Fumarylacetoacetate (FAA) hydrolase family